MDDPPISFDAAIWLTTAAIVVAVLPLLMASGPGAESRHHIGLVIAAGMVIGTLLISSLSGLKRCGSSETSYLTSAV